MTDGRRDDPYKNFNFRMAVGAVVTAIAGFALVKKLLPSVSAKYRDPKDYVSEVPSGSRPIEAVGTNVAAGRTAKKKNPRSTRRPASRLSTGKKAVGRPKRR